jgi:hypothetical protein
VKSVAENPGLAESGCVRMARNIRDLESISVQIRSLITSADSSDERRRFLAHYDACFRVVDYALVRYGYELGTTSPHVVFCKCYAVLFGTPRIKVTLLAELVKTRHCVKKSNVIPDPADVDAIRNYLEHARYQLTRS